MKKLLVVLLVALGLQTQAQINYCDSIEINLVSSSAWCNLETNIPSLNIPGIVEYDWTLVDPTAQWNWAGWDSTATPYFWLQPNTTTTNVNPAYYNDTLLICLTVVIYDSSFNQILNCYNSCEDTIFWNGTFWSKLGSVTSIGEISIEKFNNNRIYDLLGREIIGDIPNNTMYIRNNKKYIKIK